MIFKKHFEFLLSFFLLASVSAPANQAPIQVLFTLPDFIEMAQEIGGSDITVDSFLDGTEDPHFVDALPSFVSKAARADIVCAVGLDLEVGWLPKVLAKSANPKVQSGGAGFCELGKSIAVLEKISTPVDRSQGDVHAAGNPHFNLSPSALALAAHELVRVLKVARPEKSDLFEKQAQAFAERMKILKSATAAKLSPLRGFVFIPFHKEFSYFFQEYDLKSYGSIEEKPGVPPSSARIVAIAQEAQAAHVVLALGAMHSPSNYLKKFSEISKIPHIKIPALVQKNNPSLNSIEKIQNFISAELLRNAKIPSAAPASRTSL